MASDDAGGFNSRDPYHRTDSDSQPQSARAPRNGPLGARLSQRGRATQPPAFGEANPHGPYSPYPAYSPYQQRGSIPSDPGPASISEYMPASNTTPAPTWGRVTGQLKLDERVTGALHTDLQFGANWTTRSEMLRACLDEYYRLVASYNDARRLLELNSGDVEALRREKMSATARLHEVEARLEFHSRTELRAVYLGAAEAETRLFRAEEERDLLRSRAESLQGFMSFLSRIIATVRAIPPNVVMNGDGAAPSPGASAANGANGATAPDGAAATGAPPYIPASANPAETIQSSGGGERRLSGGPVVASASAAASAASQPAQDGLMATQEDFEELVLDEDEVALLPSNEFEIIGFLETADEASSAGSASEITVVKGTNANGASQVAAAPTNKPPDDAPERPDGAPASQAAGQP